jgi:excisionase family DNA binding protein
MNKVNQPSEFLSTAEAAKLLRISRVAVFKKIKKGKLKASKVGRSYLIAFKDLEPYINPNAAEDVKTSQIKKAVKKTVDEYGETLKLLGKE